MEHTRFVGLDIHKERISIAVAESGRSCAVEYLGEISNDPVAIGKLCDRPSAECRATNREQSPSASSRFSAAARAQARAWDSMANGLSAMAINFGLRTSSAADRISRLCRCRHGCGAAPSARRGADIGSTSRMESAPSC